jgi:hypothetical protein
LKISFKFYQTISTNKSAVSGGMPAVVGMMKEALRILPARQELLC